MSNSKLSVEQFSLEGKTAVVTGGHRGIGREISLALACAGADIIVIDRNGARDSDLPSRVKDLGRHYYYVQADLSDPTAITRAAQQIFDVVGHADILVNNAGVSRLEPLEKLSLAKWDQCLSVNLRAPFLLTQALANGPSGMLGRGSGVIVNITSTAGKDAIDEHGAYCASKAGLNMLTKMMTCEWGSRGIRANAVAPTVVMTKMGKEVWGQREKSKPMLAKIPQGRFAEPREVANTVVFLCSEASSMVNGAVIPVDGGYGCV